MNDMPTTEVIEHLREAIELQARRLPDELKDGYRRDCLYGLAAAKLSVMHQALMAISNDLEGDPAYQIAAAALSVVDCEPMI